MRTAAILLLYFMHAKDNNYLTYSIATTQWHRALPYLHATTHSAVEFPYSTILCGSMYIIIYHTDSLWSRTACHYIPFRNNFPQSFFIILSFVRGDPCKNLEVMKIRDPTYS